MISKIRVSIIDYSEKIVMEKNWIEEKYKAETLSSLLKSEKEKLY